MTNTYVLTKDEFGRFRSVKRMSDPALMGVLALVEGFRAAQAELDRLRYEARQAVAKAKAERRQETRTKLLAFALFDLMAGTLVYVMYAGIVG